MPNEILMFNPPGGGITNSAPSGTVPVTADGSGNLGSSPLSWNVDTDNPVFTATANTNSSVSLKAGGIGVQVFIQAANGDASHVGGEMNLAAGDSAGQGGGQLTIKAGLDSGVGDGGNLVLESGSASDGADGGGDSGEIAIRAGGSNTADSHGGQVLIYGGNGRTGGGSVQIAAGFRTVSGNHGTVQLYGGAGDSIEIAPTITMSAGTAIAFGAPKLKVNATVTAAATTGVQTIDKAAGSINFATLDSSKVLNNTTVTADSIVIATVATNDATLKSVQAVAGSGIITFYGNAAATAETRINFFVITPQ